MKPVSVALALALTTGACTASRADGSARVAGVPAYAAATSPASACPWVEGEHYRTPSGTLNPASVPPPIAAHFVPGCAIIRFTVAPDGSVSSAALRAANPLNDGPTALAVLQTMRFQPARDPDTKFVIRLGMVKDAAGNVSILPQTRPPLMRFWQWS
jgi:hypothetical protein